MILPDGSIVFLCLRPTSRWILSSSRTLDDVAFVVFRRVWIGMLLSASWVPRICRIQVLCVGWIIRSAWDVGFPLVLSLVGGLLLGS